MIRDKWLAGFIVGAAALVVAAIVAVIFARDRSAVEYPETSPVGVVQRYLLALDSGRPVAAEKYFSETLREKESGRFPAHSIGGGRSDDVARRMVLVSEAVEGETATVEVEITNFYRADPASSSSWRQRVVFELRLESGNWRITAPHYPPL